jgi:predicted negative regulator of RcsB-dependent stress response
VDRAHRQELKHDRFVERVGYTVEYAAEHKHQLIRYTIIGLVALIVGLGVSWYMRSQATARQDALREAIRKQEGQIGPAQSPYLVAFATEAEKQKAVDAAWNDLVAKYSGSDEAMIAQYYMGVNAADRGNMQEAEKHLKVVADSGKDAYASQAKLSLANIYAAQGKTAEAEKLLRSILDDPTILVSKEQATLALAKLIADSRPAEARKLLEPLRTERGPVSRAAITALNDIPAK